MGWNYRVLLPNHWVLSALFLNVLVSRTLLESCDSPFLHNACVVFVGAPASLPPDGALPQTADVKLPIMRVISSMLGIWMM